MNDLLGRSVEDWNRITKGKTDTSIFNKKSELMDFEDAVAILREFYEDDSTSGENKQMAERILFYIDTGI